MYNPLTPWVVEAHQNELLEKAKEEQRLKIARAAGPPPWGRFLVHVGDVLISTGLRLHRRYQAATYFDYARAARPTNSPQGVRKI